MSHSNHDLTMALLRACDAPGNVIWQPTERDEAEIALSRVPTKRYGELEDVALKVDACPSCLSHKIEDFDTSDRGDATPHQHCLDCGRVWRKS